MRLLAAVSVAAALAVVSGADFWRDKDPAQWTSAEARRLLTDSPWAKVITADFEPNQMRTGIPQEGGGGGRGNWGGGGGMGPGGGGGMGPGGGGGMGAGGGGGWGGGGGRGGGDLNPRRGMPEAKFAVRWESAAPVLEAAKKSEVAEAAKLAGWAKEFYVVSVTGMAAPPPGPGQRGDWSRGDPARAKQWQDLLLKITTLKRKDKPPLAAARLETIPLPSGRMSVFLFPRTDPIALDDKSVLFETAFGPIRVKSKFALKDMVWRGKLEL